MDTTDHSLYSIDAKRGFGVSRNYFCLSSSGWKHLYCSLEWHNSYFTSCQL